MSGGVVVASGYLCMALAPVGWVVVLGILLHSIGAIASPSIQGLVSASAAADRQGETQGALSSVQGLTAIVSPLVASFVFSTFTGPDAPVLLPGAPFLASVLAYAVLIWAVAGVRPVPALARAETASTAAAGPEGS
jgi:DHA1 family tetracycline resistance protein-like MFS transporter